MPALSFSKKDIYKTKKTVNRLLDSVLPGLAQSTQSPSSITSKSQLINASSKKTLKPEEVRRIKKKQKLAQRNAIKKESSKNEVLQDKARYEVLLNHSKNNTLSPAEKIELKKLVNRNVIKLQSWKSEIGEDLKEIQDEILEMKSKDVRSKRKRLANKKVSETELYDKRKKSQERKFPGLTPGLAPVDKEDSDSDDY